MKRFLPAVMLAALFFLHPPSCRADEMTDDFIWFDSLGFHDVKGLPFIKYTSAWYSENGNSTPKAAYSYGFVLKEAPEKYQLLTLNFTTREIVRDDAAKETNVRLPKNTFEPIVLKAYAESVVTPDPKRDRFYRLGGGGMDFPNFQERTNYFVLAWACWRQGLDDLAAQLYAMGRDMRDGTTSDEQGWNFRRKLEKDISIHDIWGIYLDFGKPEITRPQLLAELQAFLQKFPDTYYSRKARELADALEKMIAEDKAHPKLTEEQIAKLPPPEQAKEWVFQLRDQNGRQMSQPGWVSVIPFGGQGKVKSPGEQLVAMGDAAIPALIEALGDKSLTRSVGYGRDFHFSHQILTVGDAALQILGMMANRSFGSSRDPVAARPAVEAWWKAHQEKGDAGELIEATVKGDENSPRTAFQLYSKYPDQAVEPILAGAAASANGYTRARMIKLAVKLKDDRVQKFLIEETKEGHPLASRAQATYQLSLLGNNEGIPLMAETWLKSEPTSDMNEESSRQALITVLAVCDSPVGLNALATGLRERSVKARTTVLKAVGGTGFSMAGDMRRPKKISSDTEAAAEALLAAELEDTGDNIGFSGSENNVSIPNFRISDYAAYIMSKRWPQRYQFDTMGSYEKRELQRITCLNTWRKIQGEKSLALPAPAAPVKPEDDGKVVRVVFPASRLKLTADDRKKFEDLKGREVDASLFHDMQAICLAIADAAGRTPDSAITMNLEHNADGSGVTLSISAAELPAKYRVARDWKTSLSFTIGNTATSSSSFDKALELLKRIEPGVESSFRMTVGPTHYAEDDTL